MQMSLTSIKLIAHNDVFIHRIRFLDETNAAHIVREHDHWPS